MSHPLEEPSTANRWIEQPGPIEFRKTEHVPLPQDGGGVVRAVLAVVFGLLLGYAGWKSILWWLG